MDKKAWCTCKVVFSLSQLLLSFAVLVVATVVVAPAPSYYYCQRVRQAKTPGRRGGIIQLTSKRAILWGTKCKEIGHCRVPPGLCIKTKLSAQPLIQKWFFILMQLQLIFTRKLWNRPFPSSKKFHFQNEAKCEIFVVKMSFICIIIKNHFHINGFALSLALKVRFFGTRKWPIVVHLASFWRWGFWNSEVAYQCKVR